MIGHREILGAVALGAALLGLTAVSSQKFAEADREGAVAAALVASILSTFGEEARQSFFDSEERLLLCVETEMPIDMVKLAGQLSHTPISPISSASCRREVEEGNFGMFTAMIYYFGPSGEEAGHVEIPAMSCATSSSCVVDLDWRGWGDRYVVERHGRAWKVVRTRNRWIV